jgi:hypothetical protein
MILADRLANRLRETEDAEARKALDALDAAARFAFDAPTSELAADAVLRPDEVARAIPLPAPTAWIELALPDIALGVLFRADGEGLRHGRALVARLPNGASVLTLSTALIDMDDGGLIGTDQSTAKSILGAVALLATPSLCRKREVDMARLNRSRARSGKPPLFSHDAMTIDLGKPTASGSSEPGDGHSRRHHFVRAFLRFRLGQMQIVRPHWRGDATLGIARPHFKVRT